MNSNSRHPILLVEDDPNDVVLLKRAFQKAKVLNPIHVVGDGDQAVDYLGGAGRFTDRTEYPMPELVLLDLKLPKRSGHEVLQWIRQEAGMSDLPVVILTASEEDWDLSRAYELGTNSYLVKPARFQDLRELIETLGLYWLALNHRPEAGRQETP